MEFSGRLASFPIAELLQWAHNDRRTGSLVVRRSSREKRIYFSQGQIVACLSDQPAEFYGQHLLLGGYLREEQLLQCLAQCREDEKRLGLVLEERGILKRAEVEKTLRQHIEDMICDIFLWKHGVFFFQAEAPPEEEILADPVSTVGIAFEGTRWSDEHARIRKVLEHDDVVLCRIDRGTAGHAIPAEVAKLGPRGRRVYLEVDGQRTLEEIYRKVCGSYFRFLETAYLLCAGGLLEVGDVYEAGGVTSVELSIHDLIFEQAATEQMKRARRRLSSPLGPFERYAPVWVRQPGEQEWARMPAAVRQFYLQLDGGRRLSEILSRDEEEWTQQAELLMVQLVKETVALLPAPLPELEAEVRAPEEPAEREWPERFFAMLRAANSRTGRP